MNWCERCKEYFDELVCPFCGAEPTEIYEELTLFTLSRVFAVDSVNMFVYWRCL